MATIDVSEIINASTQQPPPKRRKAGPLENLSTATASTEEILAALENDDSQQVVIDELAVKRLVFQLDKKASKNRELRIKYVDDPQKFMESEIELNTGIQEMHAIATQPDLYPVIVEFGMVNILMQLLGHENTDIVAAIINLLQELTDVEILNESEEGAEVLIDELLKNQIIETLVQQCINRMNEENKDESDAVQNALSIIENILDFRPNSAQQCVEQGFFNWILLRATKKTTFDANKMYASQLLAQLLQSTNIACQKLTEKINGVDLLLRALASYKRHDPAGGDEYEHMENLFDALCASLMFAPNRQIFLDGEGLQLMILMLRERKQSRESALKVLSYATAIPDGRANCDKFIEILGLRTLFPLYMRTPPKMKRKDTTPDEHEEYCCSIIDALLFSCSEVNQQRVLQKFVEHEFEKVDRAIELFIKYTEKIRKWEAKMRKTETNLEPEEIYVEKLNNGLFTLQRVVLILAEICANGPVECLERAKKIFRMKTKNPNVADHLVPLLEEYRGNLGDEAKDQKDRISSLIEKLNLIGEKNNF